MITKTLKTIITLALFTAIFTAGAAPAVAADAASVQKLVDINTATQAELESIPGIGPSKAAAVVDYRTNRPFKKVEDIMRVKGIGRKTFLKMKPYLTVSSPKGGTKTTR